jgi:peptide subunit release factor 1 (eRF1)
MVVTETRGTLLEDARFDDLLQDLVKRREPEGILSVYLDIDPATAQREGYEAALLDTLRPLRARPYDTWTAGRLDYEAEAVIEAVRAWEEPPGRAVAMFYSGPGGLALTIPLPFPVRSVARFEARPVLAPLIAALEEHRRYAVVLFDKARARILTVLLGRVEEETQIESDVPGKSAVGGFGGYLQARYDRHRETHLHAHARRTVEHLWAIDRSRPIHTLILAGPPEALAALRAALPRALERIAVVAEGVPMDAITPDVVHRVEAIERAAHDAEDRAFVASLLDAARSHGPAALGWRQTLDAVADGRVHKLAVITGVTRAGVECPQCDYLAVGQLTRCPRCEEPLWEAPDLAEAAVRRALLADSTVHYLTPESGSELMPHEIGALLRY